MRKFLALLLIIVSAAVCASAYTLITISEGGSPKSPRWLSMPIPYWINDRGLSQIDNGSEFYAVHQSFQTWQEASTADVRFEYRGVTSSSTVGRDGINLISFSDEQTALGSSTLAATYSFFCTTCSPFSILEADIVFNRTFSWTTSGESGEFDIQGVLTHEIGHLLGLDHSGLGSSVMAPFGAPNQIDQRVLQYDDVAGLTELYPRAGSAIPIGQIRGSVFSGLNPVFGAHVVAMNSEGAPVVSTLTRTDGSYTLNFLPSGTYRVYAEPLDAPVTEANVGGYFTGLKTDFGTTYYGDVTTLDSAAPVQVNSSGIPSSASIRVFPKSATSLNLTRPAFAPRIARGVSGTLTMGGMDITPGVLFSASHPGLFLGSPSFSTSSSSINPTTAAIPLIVDGGTPLGPKNIAVNRGTDAAVITGTIVVVDPQPSDIEVFPATGPSAGSTRVTLTGNNFRPGAKVYFGGLPSGDVHFIDSNTLDALTPTSVPGNVNVQVVNSDGTNGLELSAYTFTTTPPTVTSAFPLEGPPATPVRIEGMNFDSRVENIEVRFNGVQARVVSSTTTTIDTVVPYGATSGNITVTAFGLGTTGPAFTVLSATPSSNTAGSTYKFVDASPSSGGIPAFSLSGGPVDDAVAQISLPFTFSFFRDVYLAGERIVVSSNGWLSFESGSVSEYQNPPLPAQTVVRPGGTIGNVPAALVAPFFDDLVLVPSTSSVTTRVTGLAPNRQFVIQWSRLSILDERGVDLNANITFEAVLFEGSNDIQFAYAAVSGPNSNGSSATIGIQNRLRSVAVQTGFNQAIVRNGYFVTYRFGDGEYVQSVAPVDNTPPTRPVVVDSGVITQSTTSLSASWSSTDEESGILEYQYAIGTVAGSSNVRAFTATTQNSITAGNLSLQAGTTYYFAVRAINGNGLASELGVSDGIRVDPVYEPYLQYIPYAPQNGSEFTGIALLAPAQMSVILKAIKPDGSPVSGQGVTNPAVVSLAPGQQYARLVSELFGAASFDGWIEVEAPAPGLGVFVATGAWNMSELDGSVPGPLSSDFVAAHSGATVVLANPSTQAVAVTMRPYEGASGASQFEVPARGAVRVSLAASARFTSSLPLAAVETLESGGRLAIVPAQPVLEAGDSFVFPHAVIGGDYESWLTLTNVGSSAVDTTVAFGSASRTVRVEANSVRQISVSDFLNLNPSQIMGGPLRVTGGLVLFGSARLLASLDILNGSGCVFMSPRGASTDVSFPHVANGNGLFTGLAIATGDAAANVTIEIYPASGGTPKTSTIFMGPNEQMARLVSELVDGVDVQVGGYIRIRSDQPIWTLEIYGSGLVMAVAPPIEE